jgi:uncharacterized protein (UPF0276 family)
MSFLEQVGKLPCLGLGVSTEYGAGDSARGLDVAALRAAHPRYASFLEVGVETLSGLDRHTRAWIAQGLPTTYHFLDVNLDEREDFDAPWLAEVREIAGRLRPAWLCGDAGLWHFGGREPGQMLLLPPVLSDGSASALAEGIVRLREETGFEVLPENPPGAVYVGDLHLLDFYGRVLARADTGMLLDCAHLAIYQSLHAHTPLTGLDGFPLDRVVEMHVAGGARKSVEGWEFIEDNHVPAVLDETWEIFEHVVPRCPNLRAVVFECERNPLPDTLPGFARIASILERAPLLGAPATTRP